MDKAVFQGVLFNIPLDKVSYTPNERFFFLEEPIHKRLYAQIMEIIIFVIFRFL